MLVVYPQVIISNKETTNQDQSSDTEFQICRNLKQYQQTTNQNTPHKTTSLYINVAMTEVIILEG